MRYEIIIRGIVQGVGFRPFVYRLATTLGIQGSVRNVMATVVIAAEAPRAVLDDFVRRLSTEAPPLATITEITTRKIAARGEQGFTIDASEAGDTEAVYISPDIALCADCRRELLDPTDRRYRYPLVNCTNCGPRLTIVKDVPYDRERTTMQAFPMCADCAREYHNPLDRRYHAQPTACPVCGPTVTLHDTAGAAVAEGDTAIRQAIAHLVEGKILAIKGLGGYHLACNARDAAAVQRLRRRKARDEKPFAVMANIAVAETICKMDDDERAVLQSPTAPIVLLPKRAHHDLPEEIAPGNPCLGVMLPYTPLHVLLFADSPLTLLVMTSGNISGEPICFDDDEAHQRLSGIADYRLTHNRPIHTRVDDSVVRMVQGSRHFIRRSRGYVPTPVAVRGLASPTPVLACGGHLKNTFCLNRGEDYYLSHHIGDLENVAAMEAFEDGIDLFQRLLGITPEIIAHDLHPAYLSTQYALGRDLPHVGIQHHRAHIAACLAENGIADDVIGVAFDGTGYGDDGRIWGGEFFTGSLSGLTRVGHLEYVTLSGGDAAVLAPWKTALGYLRHAFGADAPAAQHLLGIPDNDLSLVGMALAKRLNTYETSSMGRLFDAVTALCGLRTSASYDGQAAMELEFAASYHTGAVSPYPFSLTTKGDVFQVRTGELIRALVEERLHGATAGAMAARFHQTMAAVILEGCRLLRMRTGLRQVALSGGVFQNRLLLERAVALLTADGFTVHLHRQVPANDGGLALGQAVLAQGML